MTIFLCNDSLSQEKCSTCVYVTVRSRSLLFFNEDSPLEQSLLTSEGDGESPVAQRHTHIPTRRHTAEMSSNLTTAPKSNHR